MRFGFLKKRRLVLVTLLLLALTAGVIVLYSRTFPSSLAPGIVDIVACEESTDSLGCARPIIKKLLRIHQASEIVRALDARNLKQNECHYFSHIVGQETYLKYRNAEKALAECDKSCGLACIHGAIGEAFVVEAGLNDPSIDPEHISADDIRRVGGQLCRSPNACHGVGHALFQNKHAFKSSLAACDSVSVASPRRACYTGVFMEYDSEIKSKSMWDQASAISVPSIRSLNMICDLPSMSERRACYLYLPAILQDTYTVHGVALSREESVSKVWEICQTKSEQDRRACVSGIGSYQFQVLFKNSSEAWQLCGQFPKESDRAACVLGVVALGANFSTIHSLVTYCGRVPERDVRALCYRNIYIMVTMVPEMHESTADVLKLCPWHDAECRAGAQTQGTSEWDELTAVYPL